MVATLEKCQPSYRPPAQRSTDKYSISAFVVQVNNSRLNNERKYAQ